MVFMFYRTQQSFCINVQTFMIRLPKPELCGTIRRSGLTGQYRKEKLRSFRKRIQNIQISHPLFIYKISILKSISNIAT